MSWVDEFWKDVSWGPDSGRDCNDYDRSPDEQSPCGTPRLNEFPDHFMNEEWWGMVGTSRPCEATPDAPDRLRPRLCYLHLSLLWDMGGCTPLDAVGAGGVSLSTLSYDVADYPGCGASMHARRQQYANSGAYASDCDLMEGVHHSLGASICPLPPPHMLELNASLTEAKAAFPSVECEEPAFKGLNISAYPALLKNRLQPVGRALYLDGKPFLVRGVCYSPTPVGQDPGYGEPWGDYFTTDHYKIFTRDIALFVEMGANTIRLYTFKTSQRHQDFLDSADRAGLIVMGAFEIGTAEHTPLATETDRDKVKERLRRQMRFSPPPVLTLWFVGNEMNGPWQGFVCETSYAERYLDFAPGECQFKDDAYAMMMVLVRKRSEESGAKKAGRRQRGGCA